MESLRAKAFRVKTGLQKRVDEKEPKRPIFHALMGDGTGGDPRTHCQVEDEPNLVYVRVTGRGVMQAIYNQDLPVRHDLPVLVGPTQENPDVYEVLGLDQAAWTGPGEYRYIGLHHEAHEFRNANGGDDVVWVQKSQFVPFLGSPTDPPSMQLYIQPGFYLYLADWQYWPGGNVDLTGHGPAAGLARYVLITIDGETNTAVMTDGADFAIFPPTNPSANIPDCPTGSFPVTAVYMLDTTTELTWDNTYDVRLMVGGGTGTELPGPHHLIDDTVHDDTAVHAALVEGDMIYGFDDGANPVYWEKLAMGVTNSMLIAAAGVGGNVPVWLPFDWDSVSAAVGADMEHDHSGAGEGGTVLREIWRFGFHDVVEDLLWAAAATVSPWYSYRYFTNAANPTHVRGVDTTGTEHGSIIFLQNENLPGENVVLDHLGGAAADEDMVLAAGADYQLGKHPLLFVRSVVDDKWYEIGWSGASGGAGAHDLLSATHSDTVAAAVSRGSIIRGVTNWQEYPYPGDRHHLQTDDQDVIWDQDISMEPDHWIGLGDVTGYGGGMARIKFISGGLGRDAMAHLDGDVGIGTEEPNIAGEAVGLTIESATGAPTFELSLKDDLFGANQLIGTIRWWAGVDTPCHVGQIDVIQDSWYETQSTMRFWAADDCALCLGMELDCNGLMIHESLGVGIVPTSGNHIYAYNDAINTTESFSGIRTYHVKTAGVTDASDVMYGLNFQVRLDQAGGTLGRLYGSVGTAVLDDGTLSYIYGTQAGLQINNGTVNTDVRGLFSLTDINDGSINCSVYGGYFRVDIESAVDALTGPVCGLYVWVDDDKGATQPTYMVYLQEFSGIDYGLYQNGSAPNVLGGTIAAVHGDHWGLEDYHAGTVTDTGYVEVDINGVTYQLLARLPA